MSEENKNKGSWGCFIFVFILIAAGIPAATKGEGPIGNYCCCDFWIRVGFLYS
ncbi:MAG: hypothetical protein ACLVJI_05895 [Bacilli bacterium]